MTCSDFRGVANEKRSPSSATSRWPNSRNSRRPRVLAGGARRSLTLATALPSRLCLLEPGGRLPADAYVSVRPLRYHELGHSIPFFLRSNDVLSILCRRGVRALATVIGLAGCAGGRPRPFRPGRRGP
jgi:hypothetical protein